MPTVLWSDWNWHADICPVLTSVPLLLHSNWDRFASESKWLRATDGGPHACRCLRDKFPGMSMRSFPGQEENRRRALWLSLSLARGAKELRSGAERGYWDIHWRRGEVSSASEASKLLHNIFTVENDTQSLLLYAESPRAVIYCPVLHFLVPVRIILQDASVCYEPPIYAFISF